jgi:hypothetical protein
VNESPTHAHHRYAINFADFPLRRDDLGFTWKDANERQRTECLRDGIVPLDYPDPVAADWPDLLTIVEERVKPERLAQNREIRARYWWRYGERAPALYDAIRGLKRVLAISLTTKHMAFAFLPSGTIYAHRLGVFAREDYATFTLLQSRVHEVWARALSSTQTDRLLYTPFDVVETFPEPSDDADLAPLEAAGRRYYETRAALMQTTGQGLTVLYNRFNDPEERDQAIVDLRELHAAMDREVLDAYGWTDLHPVAIYEREWEVEEGEQPAPWRLRWPEADRDMVLARLLELNQRRHEEESQEIPPTLPPRRRRRRVAPTELVTLLN